jgi:hypothetical protein
MFEVHGLARLTKIQTGPENSRTLTVEDGAKSVILRIYGESYSTGMTPEEAIWLARQLTESAKRVRRAAAASPPA